MTTEESPLMRLEHMGFRRVGAWELVDDPPHCVLAECADAANILYAFVVAGAVVYIGKTVQALKRRLYGYQRPGPSQSTNSKGNELLVKALRAAQAVEIYALPDNGLLYYGGFHVNLAAGLEDNLVGTLKPSWNRAGI